MTNECQGIANRFNYVKSKVSLKRVIEDNSCELKESGSYFKSSCVFCKQENSFTMSRHKDVFYCFGCHVSGDVISFIAKLKNISQIDSVKFLEEKYLKDEPTFNWPEFKFNDPLLEAVFKSVENVSLEKTLVIRFREKHTFFKELLDNTQNIWVDKLRSYYNVNHINLEFIDGKKEI